MIALGVGALFMGGGFAGLWGARRPVLWALLSAGGTAAVFMIAYARLRGMDGLPPWGLVSLIIAALHVAAAERLAHRGVRLTLGTGVTEVRPDRVRLPTARRF